MSATASVRGKGNGQEGANGSAALYRRKDGRLVDVWEDFERRIRYVTSKTKTKAEMSTIIRKYLEGKENGIAHDSQQNGTYHCWASVFTRSGKHLPTT
jgi:hypothetical protein